MAEVIPFVCPLPRYGQMTCRYVRRIDYRQRSRLNGRMPLKVGSHQPAIPGPLVARVAGCMNADKSAAAADESFECRPLVRFQNFAGCVQENDYPVAGKIFIRKSTGVFAGVHVKTITLTERADGIDTCGNGIVT